MAFLGEKGRAVLLESCGWQLMAEAACSCAGLVGLQGWNKVALMYYIRCAPAGPSLPCPGLHVALLCGGALTLHTNRFCTPGPYHPSFAGITWVLSEQVVHMEWPVWQQRCAALAAGPQSLDEPRLRREQPQLWEWLQHQRGLASLGWLPPRRRAALEALQVGMGVRWAGQAEEWRQETDSRAAGDGQTWAGWGVAETHPVPPNQALQRGACLCAWSTQGACV